MNKLEALYQWAQDQGVQFFFVRVFRQTHEDPEKNRHSWEWKWEAVGLEWYMGEEWKSFHHTCQSVDELYSLLVEGKKLQNNKVEKVEEDDFMSML